MSNFNEVELQDICVRLGDKEYYGLEDIILNVDVDMFKTQNKQTGVEINTYEFMWRFLKETLEKRRSENYGE